MSRRSIRLPQDQVDKRLSKNLDLSAVWDALETLDRNGIDIGDKARTQVTKLRDSRKTMQEIRGRISGKIIP